MPFIEIKMYPRELTREKKVDLANKLIETARAELGAPITAFTVTVEEIAKDQWADKVHPREDLVVIDHGTVKIQHRIGVKSSPH